MYETPSRKKNGTEVFDHPEDRRAHVSTRSRSTSTCVILHYSRIRLAKDRTFESPGYKAPKPLHPKHRSPDVKVPSLKTLNTLEADLQLGSSPTVLSHQFCSLCEVS